MDIRKKQRAVVDALQDIKGHDIVVLNTAHLPSMFERVVIASGDSTRQVKALADNVEDKLRALGVRIYGVEGALGAEWVLVDLGDVIVHIMHPTVRSYYNLEEIWGGKEVRVRSAPHVRVNRPAAPRPATKRASRPRKRATARKHA